MSKLKQQQIFAKSETKVKDHEATIAQGQEFSSQDAFVLCNSQLETPELEQDFTELLLAKSTKKSWWRMLLKFGLGAIGALMVWQNINYIYSAWLEQDYIALGWGGALNCVALAGVGAILKEIFKLKKLRNRETEREKVVKLLAANGLGQAQTLCKDIAKNSNINLNSKAYNKWLAALATTHNDEEVFQLYDSMVVTTQDQLARRLIQNYSRQAALMVAVSPLAMVDMLLVAWRSLSLIDKLALVYGVELGYWSRIRLFKLVLVNMALTGASELVIDTGIDALSMDLAGKLSTRVAQGVGVGLITGRLGLKAMDIMRPLPWMGKKPSLNDIRRDLLRKLQVK